MSHSFDGAAAPQGQCLRAPPAPRSHMLYVFVGRGIREHPNGCGSSLMGEVIVRKGSIWSSVGTSLLFWDL